MAYHPTVPRQLLQWVPRLEFERLVTKLDGLRRSDTLSRWSQFLALVVGHVGQRQSLRDIESALMKDRSLRYHRGTRSVSRSALARGTSSSTPISYRNSPGCCTRGCSPMVPCQASGSGSRATCSRWGVAR